VKVMIEVSERSSRALFRPALPAAPPEPARPRGWWRYAAALLLGGYLLFAHGCHGDEDKELFAASGERPVSAGWSCFGAEAGPAG
jgi:hypothetical protein